MSVSLNDLISAKRILSKRLLKSHLSALGTSRMAFLSVASAVSAAGRGVHSVGVGRKLVDGKPVGALCIRLYVSQKIAPSLLSPRDMLPKEIDGLPTDVVETGAPVIQEKKKAAKKKVSSLNQDAVVSSPAACSSNRRLRQRPAPAGISAAHRNVTAGTLSCYCRSRRLGDDPGQVFALSNNHVFANVNQALVGDDLYQQSPADGGTAGEHFADLHRFVTIHLGGSTPNRVDAALGLVLDASQISTSICSIGPITGIIAAQEDMVVRKHGRTSGYTEGIIDDISVDAVVGMDHADPSVVALFQDQLRINATAPHPAFGLGGDSGSLVVHGSQPKAVGLYFAGPPGGEYGLANPISDVLSELEIDILP